MFQLAPVTFASSSLGSSGRRTACRRAPKTFFLRNYGCQMNELESETMVGMLEKRGMTRVEREEEADLLLFHTCSIRDLAERKVMGKVGKLTTTQYYRQHQPLLGITGCMATAKKSALFEKLPQIDFILGPNNIGELNTVLDRLIEGEQRLQRVDHLINEEINYLAAKRDHTVKTSVSIIRGCDKFCTYCVVPYTRGRESSRHPDELVNECRQLVDQGYRELNLLGQNVNSYGKDHPEWNCLFHDLLERIDRIPGLQRLRFITSHPVDITRELMAAVRDLPTVCEFVHFPLQAGSNRILKKMHRLYTKEEYFEKVAQLKEMVPNVALGTDIIVGFPTETEEDFMESYHAMEQIGFSVAFIFAYSPRKGTPALRWKDDVSETVKQDRLQRLLQLHQKNLARIQMERLGTIQEVLVEQVNKDGKTLRGRTRLWEKIIFQGDPSLLGTIQQVQVAGYSYQTFVGTQVTS